MDLRPRLPRKISDWVLIAFGLWVFLGAGYGLLMGAASLVWPQVDGVVTYSQIPRSYRTTEPPDVRYKFTVDGREHTGNHWRYLFVVGRSVNLKSTYEMATLASYPVGQPVKVYVSPWSASDSVLEPGIAIDNVFWTLAGAVIVLYVVAPWPRERRTGRGLSGARIFAFGGVALVLLGLYDVYHGSASLFWPTTPGKVLFSQLASASSGGSGSGGIGVVRYEYEVNGARVLAEDVRGGLPGDAKAWLRANPVGRAVTVHYNPLDASDSVLKTGIEWNNFILPAIGLVLFGWSFMLRKAEIVMERAEKERDAERERDRAYLARDKQ